MRASRLKALDPAGLRVSAPDTDGVLPPHSLATLDPRLQSEGCHHNEPVAVLPHHRFAVSRATVLTISEPDGRSMPSLNCRDIVPLERNALRSEWQKRPAGMGKLLACFDNQVKEVICLHVELQLMSLRKARTFESGSTRQRAHLDNRFH